MKFRFFVIFIFFILSSSYITSSSQDEYYISFSVSSLIINDTLGQKIINELETEVISSGIYKLAKAGVSPDLNISICLNKIGNIEDQENLFSVISITYILFPQTINYHAETLCRAIKIEDTEEQAKSIVRIIKLINYHYYEKAKKIEEIVKASSQKKLLKN